MLLADIESRVNAAIRSNQVFGRVLALALETIELSDEHKRSASYSPCECPYCAAIKIYVRAKIRCGRLESDRHAFTSRMMPSEMDLHNANVALKVARYNKEIAKNQLAYPALLRDSS